MSSLDEDSGGQKMQLAYRLQQVAALLENKVTDLWSAYWEQGHWPLTSPLENKVTDLWPLTSDQPTENKITDLWIAYWEQGHWPLTSDWLVNTQPIQICGFLWGQKIASIITTCSWNTTITT